MTLQAIEENEPEISPSTIFAVASVLEGSMYINGSPQNTFVPGVIELAERRAPSRLPPHCLRSQSPLHCRHSAGRTHTCMPMPPTTHYRHNVMIGGVTLPLHYRYVTVTGTTS